MKLLLFYLKTVDWHEYQSSLHCRKDAHVLVALHVFLDFSGSSLREDINKLHHLWHVELTEISTTMFDEFFLAARSTNFQYEKSTNRFGLVRMWKSYSKEVREQAQITRELLNYPDEKITARKMEIVKVGSMRHLNDKKLGYFSKKLP